MPCWLSWRAASPSTLARVIDLAGAWPFTYPHVSATHTSVPAGFQLDTTSAQLGWGEQDFEHARALLRAWAPFTQPWLTTLGTGAPPARGQVVLLHARHFGLWSLNACRVIYVEDVQRCFAFAYGTLPLHAVRGEERFEIRWHDDDRVTFCVTAFSRPGSPFVWLGYPLMRLMQRRFARLAVMVMAQAMNTPAARPDAESEHLDG